MKAEPGGQRDGGERGNFSSSQQARLNLGWIPVGFLAGKAKLGAKAWKDMTCNRLQILFTVESLQTIQSPQVVKSYIINTLSDQVEKYLRNKITIIQYPIELNKISEGSFNYNTIPNRAEQNIWWWEKKRGKPLNAKPSWREWFLFSIEWM